MEELYYKIQLISFPLVFVYGLFFLLDPAPEKVYRNHVLGRKLFGLTLLIWAVYIGMTYFFSIASINPIINVSVNLSRFYIFGSLLEIAFSALVDNHYPIVIKTRNRLILWVVYMTIMAINVLFVPEQYQWSVLFAAALYYAFEVYAILCRYFKVYKTMKTKMDNYHSKNVESFTKWMLASSYGLGAIGYSAIGLAFAPIIGLLLFMAVGILFFTYMSYSLYRYTLSIGYIKEAVMDSDDDISKEVQALNEEKNSVYIVLAEKIDDWIANDGYTQPSINIQQLATQLETNRTYLSNYINSKYSLTFRDWIAKLRIDYAKKLLLENPDLSVANVSQKVGYSNSNFTANFIKQYGMSPAQWRKKQL